MAKRLTKRSAMTELPADPALEGGASATEESPPSTPALSVIICTIDRYDDLEACLAALDPRGQLNAPDYEVLVIDQTPHRRRRAMGEAFPFIRQIFQDATGLSVARNGGVREAKAPILAFLDDDAVPCAAWAAEIAAAFAGEARQFVRAAGGRVDADWRRGDRPGWMTPSLEAYLSCINWSDSDRPLKKGEWIVGANMAYRAEVFTQIGLFDEQLGRKGNKSLLSNEEIAIINRIGHENIMYVPKAQVAHVIHEARYHQVWFRKRVYWQAVSDLLGGLVWASDEVARGWIADFIARCPAELRSFRAFFFDCEDADLFARQLNAIYGFVILGADGFKLWAIE